MVSIMATELLVALIENNIMNKKIVTAPSKL